MTSTINLHTFFIKNKFVCVALIMMFLLVAFVSMLRPIAIGYLFHHGYQVKNIDRLSEYINILLILNGMMIAFCILRALIYVYFELNILFHLQTVVMKKLLQLPLYFFDRYTTGDIVHRVLWLISLGQLFSSNHIGLLLSFISLLISFTLMFYFNWQFTMVVFFLIAIFTVFAACSARRLLPQLEEYAKDMGNAYGFLFQAINGITRIKHFAREPQVELLWSKRYIFPRRRLQETYAKGVLGYAFFNSIPLLLLLIIFTLCPVQVDYQSFIIFFSGLCLLIIGIGVFFIHAGSIIDALIAYRRVQPILSAPDEKKIHTLEEQPFECLERIDLQDIHFTYPGSSLSILRGVNCHIAAGEHVAFIGLSGSGKSTLMKLLLGFYQPQHGQIKINNHPFQSIDKLKFRSAIGIVFQDGQLMNGSILENIVGHSTATEEDAWKIVHDLELDEFIAALPMGIHTAISQHAHLLSGGQKQRLLIARALISKPQLLILDEATNSLDNLSQKVIINYINQLGATRITIAHRLATIKDVNQIFVLHQGKIIQKGTYQQLMCTGGLFTQLALF